MADTYDQSDSALISQWRFRTGREPWRCIVGKEDGTVYLPNQPGYVWVRRRLSLGFGAPFRVRVQGLTALQAGNAVLVWPDEDGELAIHKGDFYGQLSGGNNPITINAPPAPVQEQINQTAITTAVCVPFSPQPAMKAVVQSWPRIVGNRLTVFPRSVTGTIATPSTGEHYLVLISLKLDNTLELTYSDPQSQVVELDTTDLQEALDDMSRGSVPIQTFRIYGGQTELRASDRWLDMRQFIYGGSYLEMYTPNVSNPPTDAELDSAFGTPATVGKGFTVVVDDNGGDTNVYLVTTNGTSWWYASLTKAT